MSPVATARWRALSISRVLVVLIALVPTLIFVFVAVRRIGYPYELEWLEGGAVEIAGRVAHGQGIYVAPSIHYVPYPYTPLYFWVTGSLAHFMGVGFLPLRLVSFISSLGACALLVRIVWRETGDVVAGVVASGLFTATFAVSGAWLDIGRVDAMALLLLLLAFYLGRHARGIGGGIVVGVVAFLAFMTKQSDLLALLPVLVVLVIFRRRVGLPALATVAALVVGSTALLDATSHGWYGYYAFQELLHQGEIHSVWRTFFTKDLWHTPWAIGLGLIALLLSVRYRRLASTDWLYWGSAIVGLLLAALVSRLHAGGGPDVLIPAYAATALMGAFGYDALLRAAKHAGANGHRAGWLAVVPTATSFVLVLVVAVQIGALHYSTSRFLPTASDRVAGEHLIALGPSNSGTRDRGRSPFLRHARRQGLVGAGRSGPRRPPRWSQRGAHGSGREHRKDPAVRATAHRVRRRPRLGAGPSVGALLPAQPHEGFRVRALLLPRDGSQTPSGLRLRAPLTPSVLVELDEPTAGILPVFGDAKVCCPGDQRGVRCAQGGPVEPGFPP